MAGGETEGVREPWSAQMPSYANSSRRRWAHYRAHRRGSGGTGDYLAPEELIGLLTAPQHVFGSLTGVELLAAGDVATVVALVTYVVTPSDLGAPPA